MKVILAIFMSSFLCLHLVKGNAGYLSADDSLKFNSFIAGTDYTSNTSSFGRFSSSAKQPSFSVYTSFFSKYGFNAGISGYAIANTDSTATQFTYQYDLNLGYDLTLGQHFSLSASYAHSFYSENSFSLNSIYNDEFSAGLNFNLGKLYANSSVYYMVGDKNDWMNSVNAGFNFEINNAFFKGHSISISPDFGAIMSNQQYYNQYAFKTYWYLYSLAKWRPDITIQRLYNSPELYTRLWTFLNNHPRKLKEFTQLDKSLLISDLFKVESDYNFSSASFTLPVYYNVGNFSVNLIYSVTFPMNVPEYIDNSAIHYFSAGLMYTFIL